MPGCLPGALFESLQPSVWWTPVAHADHLVGKPFPSPGCRARGTRTPAKTPGGATSQAGSHSRNGEHRRPQRPRSPAVQPDWLRPTPLPDPKIAHRTPPVQGSNNHDDAGQPRHGSGGEYSPPAAGAKAPEATRQDRQRFFEQAPVYPSL